MFRFNSSDFLQDASRKSSESAHAIREDTPKYPNRQPRNVSALRRAVMIWLVDIETNVTRSQTEEKTE